MRRELVLKDWKNYSSLCRLCFCLVYCTLQLVSIRTESVRVELELEAVQTTLKDLRGRRGEDDEEGDDAWGKEIRKRERAVKELRSRRGVLLDVRSENEREMVTAACNLVILLNRLPFGGVFRRTPTWGVGLLGMVAAWLGLQKNWPAVSNKGKE